MEVDKREFCWKGRMRSYEIVDGKLKWGRIGNEKFQFVPGRKYIVRHENAARTKHEGAVGILRGARLREGGCDVILECCGRKFYSPAEALLPWQKLGTATYLR